MHKKNLNKIMLRLLIYSGLEGFEPPNDWVRANCLTAWR